MNHKILHNRDSSLQTFSIKVYEDENSFIIFHAFKFLGDNNNICYGFFGAKSQIKNNTKFVKYLIQNNICKIIKFIPLELYLFKFHTQFLLEIL